MHFKLHLENIVLDTGVRGAGALGLNNVKVGFDKNDVKKLVPFLEECIKTEKVGALEIKERCSLDSWEVILVGGAIGHVYSHFTGFGVKGYYLRDGECEEIRFRTKESAAIFLVLTNNGTYDLRGFAIDHEPRQRIIHNIKNGIELTPSDKELIKDIVRKLKADIA